MTRMAADVTYRNDKDDDDEPRYNYEATKPG